MPRFLISVVLAFTLSLFGLSFIVLKTSPESTKNLVFFFIFLFLMILFGSSLLIYSIKFKLAPKHSSLGTIYKRSFKVSLFVALTIVGLGVLKAFLVFTPFNALLVILFFGSVYKLLSRP